MNNLIVRSLTGIVFVASIILPIIYSQPVAMIIFSIYFVLGVTEYFKLFKSSEMISINWQLSSFYTVLIYGLTAFVIIGKLPAGMIAFVPVIIFKLMLTELWRKKEQPIYNTAINLMGVFYLVVPFSLILLILNMKGPDFSLLIGMFILIWTNDSFAYLTGRMIGKHKMIERISPNKTWEGTIGGVVFSLIAGVLIGYLTDQMLFWTVAAMVISPGAIFGDLLESLFKRNLKIKDSGNILPGHGGILDRFDATLFVVPFYFVWIIIYSFVL